jgi:hypothetical protein
VLSRNNFSSKLKGVLFQNYCWDAAVQIKHMHKRNKDREQKKRDNADNGRAVQLTIRYSKDYSWDTVGRFLYIDRDLFPQSSLLLFSLSFLDYVS